MKITSTITPLIAARKSWQAAAYKASNDELYALLASCFDFYLAVAKSYDLPKALDALLRTRGYVFTNSTSLPLKIVRLIFAEPENQDLHKHRLLTYARVLGVAKEQGQTPETLAAFIAQHGGIDEIRRSGTKAGAQRDKEAKRREDASAELAMDDYKPLFKLTQLPKELQPEEGERYSLALVRRNFDGSGAIVFGTGNKTVVGQVLAIAGKSLEESSQQNVLQDRDAKIADRQRANLAKIKEQQTKSFSPELTFDVSEQAVAEAVN